MKKRILSALVALIILVPIIFVGGKIFTFAALIIGSIGFYEFIKCRENNKSFPISMKVISYLLFLCLLLSNQASLGLDYKLDFGYFASSIFLVFIPIIFYDSKKYNINDAIYLFGSIFFLGLAFNCLISLRNYNLNYFIFLSFITIFTDTFAYTTGMLIGKHKLAPVVSPKKSIEGLIGGLIFGTFISTVFYISAFSYTGNIFVLISIILFLSLIGQLGDLVFSSIKREYKIKDYGNIMPGHGGVLDRLDSILFVILAFSLVSSLL